MQGKKVMKGKKIAIVLSGCGYLDGSEINEVVLTLLALDRAGIAYEGIAPDRDQHHVINHLTESVDEGSRNILEESARMMRGNVKALDKANVTDYDALIFPGGFGAAKNLFNLALKGDISYRVQPDILAFASAALEAKKPMGYICIAPMMIPEIYPEGVQMTIGTDEETAKLAESKGAKHVLRAVDEICCDQKYKLVTTPAYMLGKNTYEVSKGIDRMVKVLQEFI